MIKKILIPFLIITLIAAGAIYYYVFVYSIQNHRNIIKEEAIIVVADSLIQVYSDNEISANAKYLNKVLEIKGILIDTATNQQQALTLTMGDKNSLSFVYVTLNSLPTFTFKLGDSVKVKGVCAGLLSDVVINDAVLIK